MVLEKMEAGVVVLSNNHAELVDNPSRAAEAQTLRLAMKFVLHLCGEDVMHAVFESMCVNIENQCGPSLLTREACGRWLKGSSTR